MYAPYLIHLTKTIETTTGDNIFIYILKSLSISTSEFEFSCFYFDVRYRLSSSIGD